MEFTTRLELHSQATRLSGTSRQLDRSQGYGGLTLSAAVFQRTYPRHSRRERGL